AVEIGPEPASRLAGDRALFGLSEHLFAADLFGPGALDSDHFLATVARSAGLPAPFDDLAFLRRVRDETVPRFLDAVAARVLACAPRAVGFSSPFNQVMSSLALAARIKRAAADVQVLCGGACFDGEMGREYHRALPHVVDHVFLGEAEEPFREYLRRVRAGEPTAGIPGTTYAAHGEVRWTAGRPLPDLSASPVPDYDDYFAEKDRVAAATGVTWSVDFLPFESSRGCWWGEKSHCMFCGLDRDLMAFRPKPAPRVVDEIVALSRRYAVPRLSATDWIVSRDHRRQVCDALAARDLDVELFYETRSDTTKDELRAMREGGVWQIQPGIESFSTPLLKLMRKGTTGLRQVQFLRWAREYGFDVQYNLLAGFPGERAEWYAEMAALVPRLLHLQPPLANVYPVEMHRFSPLFTEPRSWGVTKHAIRRDYRFNFPPGLLDSRKVGYAFEYETERPLVPDETLAPLRAAVERWMAVHREGPAPAYAYALGPGYMHVQDTRAGRPRALVLRGLERDVAVLCDEIQTLGSLERALAERLGAVAAPAVAAAVERLLAIDVLLAEGRHYLLLPVARRPRSAEALRRHLGARGTAAP
ncbi:MAG TPA: RiPP maturation radical SAM C-methyltransferase, partial [Methylomirabilota bacterium]|nr:RiPP maturation radical SAM C-methyltransferase [Methylomirabilota bacterium]